MHWALTRIIVLSIALTLDLLIGDPQNPLHPIRFIGSGISMGIRLYRKAKPSSKAVQFIAGAVLSIGIISLAFLAAFVLTRLVYGINQIAGVLFEGALCYFLLAAKSLKVESMKVYTAVMAGDISQARYDLSMIVSRDTASLNQTELIKGAVETVAENLSDGVIAPLIFICIGGAPIGMAYKAVNTLDSMIGYKTDEFLYFGKFAARLDDAVNFIPARCAAVFLILGSLLAKADFAQARRIFLRDRKNHASPNSAQTMSACAGALRLQLGGDAYYHGELVHKPSIGDHINELQPEHIVAANRLMYAATLIAAAFAIAVCAACFLIGGLFYV
ncbi:MAG: adenosylcobinamide-phosphate synthase CbiB [Coriobacteriia bacterium]|nr:adenosylcobinamide-phosphate synthase CbiB [Coriobacteriia bacterium]